MTSDPGRTLAVEYAPTPADALEVRRFMHGRALRHPPLVMVLAGCAAIAAGGAMMGAIGSNIWLALAFFGLALPAMLLLAWVKIAPTAAKLEQEFERRPWLGAPYRIRADEEGVRYEHGPFRATLKWAAFSSVVESEHALVLLEHPSPGALVYGLSKRELERTPGGATAWRELLVRRIRSARRT
jgi:hypothetical protein